MGNNEYTYVSRDDIESAEAGYICGTADYPTHINGIPVGYIDDPGTYMQNDLGEYVKVG